MFCCYCGNALSQKKMIDDRHYEMLCVNCKSKLAITTSYYTGMPTEATWFKDEWRKNESGRWVLRF